MKVADKKVWIDGRVVDGDEARVPVFDRGFLYGDSVYEVFRTTRGEAFALDEHLDRLAESARLLYMELPPRDLVRQASLDAAKAITQAGSDAYVRIVVTRGAGTIGLAPELADAPRLVVIAQPLVAPDEDLRRTGVEVAIVAARRNPPGGLDPRVKSGNYLPSVLAIAEARRRGAYEGIMTDAMGRLAEGSSSNVFVVLGGRVLTPALEVGILDGITRRLLLRYAGELGIPVAETNLWPSDLAGADEAFLTSTTRGVLPICAVDGQKIASCPGPLTTRLGEALQAHGGE